MKLAKLSSLSVAIMMVSSAHANQLIDDATLDLHAKNYYKHNTIENDPSAGVNQREDSHTQWVQTVSISFKSGYFGNILGFDLGTHNSFKLRGDDNSNNGLLRPSTRDEKVHSYGKTTYALKVNLMDMGVAKYGRMFIETPLLKNTDFKALPSLTEGFYAEGSFDELDIYGLIALKENADTQSGFNNYGYNDGNDTHSKSVQILGAGYDFGHGISTNIAFGQQKDIAQRYFADLNYSTMAGETKLDLGLQYANNAATGFAKDSIKNSNTLMDKDTNQYMWGAKIAASIDKLTLGLAYTVVEKTDMGYFNHTWGTTDSSNMGSMANARGYFGYNSMMYGNFNRNGQKSWGVNASYDFNNMIKGLKVNAAYVSGTVNPTGANNPDSWKEKEYNVGFSYDIAMVEGLSTHVMFAHNTQEDQGLDSSNRTANLINADTRVMVKYDIAIF